jgi:hypothetical protein
MKVRDAEKAHLVRVAAEAVAAELRKGGMPAEVMPTGQRLQVRLRVSDPIEGGAPDYLIVRVLSEAV